MDTKGGDGDGEVGKENRDASLEAQEQKQEQKQKQAPAEDPAEVPDPDEDDLDDLDGMYPCGLFVDGES